MSPDQSSPTKRGAAGARTAEFLAAGASAFAPERPPRWNGDFRGRGGPRSPGTGSAPGRIPAEKAPAGKRRFDVPPITAIEMVAHSCRGLSEARYALASSLLHLIDDLVHDCRESDDGQARRGYVNRAHAHLQEAGISRHEAEQTSAKRFEHLRREGQ